MLAFQKMNIRIKENGPNSEYNYSAILSRWRENIDTTEPCFWEIVANSNSEKNIMRDVEKYIHGSLCVDSFSKKFLK